MEFGKVILFELGNHTIYLEMGSFLLLAGSLLLQGVMVFRVLAHSSD